MAALPKSSTVVVHTVIDGRHSAMAFTEVDVAYDNGVEWTHSPPGADWWPAESTHTITGREGYVFNDGDTAQQVYTTLLAHQVETTAELRKERDEARRDRDAALREVASLKESILRIVDPDSFSDEDEDDGDFCEQCYDYH